MKEWFCGVMAQHQIYVAQVIHWASSV